jgi:hypothetical protein
MKVSPKLSKRIPNHEIVFCALAGSKTVKIEQEVISGVATSDIVLLQDHRKGALVEEFVNCDRTPQRILTFTKRFGPLFKTTDPLNVTPVSSSPFPEPNRENFTLRLGPRKNTLRTDSRGFYWLTTGSFDFPLDRWRKKQDELRENWKRLCGTPVVTELKTKTIGGPSDGTTHVVPKNLWEATQSLEVAEGERMIRVGDKLLYVAANLLRLLYLDLWSVAPNRVRLCANPSCEQVPYFVAHDHLSQKYCSTFCAENWGQRKARDKWWAEKGKQARALRNKEKRKQTMQTRRKK